MIKQLLVLIISSLCVVPFVGAQTLMIEKASELLKQKELQQSWQAIQRATLHPETAQSAHAWYVRSYVSKELFKDNPQENASYAPEALKSAQKSIALDTEGKYRKNSQAVAKFIYTSYYNQVVGLLNAEKYSEALSKLTQLTHDSDELNDFDAEALYLTGYAYLMLNQTDSVQHYFSRALAAGHRDPLIYETLSSHYLTKGEVGKARTMADMGLILYTDDRGLQIAELNTLMKESQYEKAADAAEQYLSSYKKDTEVMLPYGTIQGRLFEINGEEKHFQNRVSTYEKVLKLEPNNLQANYNLGITYYNKGVELINNDEVFEKDIFEFDQLLNVSTGLFQKALPFVLKASQIDRENYNTLKALEGIYYSLNEQEKLAQVQDQISSLNDAGR